MILPQLQTLFSRLFSRRRLNHNPRDVIDRIGMLVSQVKQLQQEHTSLLAQIAVKDEALKHARHFIGYVGKQEDASYFDKVNNALTNSPAAAQEMVERMERMDNDIKRIKDALDSIRKARSEGRGFEYHFSSLFFRCEHLNNTFSITKQPEGGV